MFVWLPVLFFSIKFFKSLKMIYQLSIGRILDNFKLCSGAFAGLRKGKETDRKLRFSFYADPLSTHAEIYSFVS